MVPFFITVFLIVFVSIGVYLFLKHNKMINENDTDVIDSNTDVDIDFIIGNEETKEIEIDQGQAQILSECIDISTMNVEEIEVDATLSTDTVVDIAEILAKSGNIQDAKMYLKPIDKALLGPESLNKYNKISQIDG